MNIKIIDWIKSAISKADAAQATADAAKATAGAALPKSGGTMTGPIIITEDPTTAAERGWSGIASQMPEANMAFVLGAWPNDDILSPYISMYRGDRETDSGVINLRARNAKGDSKYLVLKPDGTMVWGGKDVSCIYSSGDDWIRYTNGIQIVWGSYTRLSGTSGGQVKTLPAAFVNAYYRISVTDTNESTSFISPYQNILVYAKTTTSFKLASTSNKSGDDALDFIAIGRWK